MKGKIKVFSLILAAVLGAGVLSGCGSSEVKSSQQSEGETNKKEGNNELVFAYNGSAGNLIAFAAEDKGYFKEEGLNVKFEEFNSTSDGIAAMNAGKVDVSFSFGSNSPLQYISEGSDLVFIGGYVSGGHPIVTKPENAQDYDSSSKSAFAKSFEGKNVGILRLYTSQIVWEAALREEGIDTSSALTTTEFKKPSDLVAAVRAGQVDVGVITNGSYTMAKKAGLSVVGYSHDLWPDHICCRGIVSREYYDEHPDELKNLLKALLRAQRDLEADKDYAISLNAELLNIDKETSEALLFETGQTRNTDPDKKGIEEMYDTMVDQKLIEKEFDVDSYIDVNLYKEALKELLDASPEDSFYKEQWELFQKQDESEV